MTNTFYDNEHDADLLSLGDHLTHQAIAFTGGGFIGGSLAHKPQSWTIFDIEYCYNRQDHDAYVATDGAAAHKYIRWPFHNVAAACWITVHYDAANAVLRAEAPVVMAADLHSERQMLTQLFDALAKRPSSIATTWAGEAKDYASLRRAATFHGLRQPPQLCNTWTHHRDRLDLCRVTRGQAEPIHLPELLAALSIPCKPSPSKEIGKLVENGDWAKVKEQVLADVLATTALAVRHLYSHRVIDVDPDHAMLAVAKAAADALTHSRFVHRTFLPWAEGRSAKNIASGAAALAA